MKASSAAAWIYLLIGIIGFPIYLLQWHQQSEKGWICYSRHGGILETPSTCQLQVGVGLVITGFALSAALFRLRTRGR